MQVSFVLRAYHVLYMSEIDDSLVHLNNVRLLDEVG